MSCSDNCAQARLALGDRGEAEGDDEDALAAAARDALEAVEHPRAARLLERLRE